MEFDEDDDDEPVLLEDVMVGDGAVLSVEAVLSLGVGEKVVLSVEEVVLSTELNEKVELRLVVVNIELSSAVEVSVDVELSVELGEEVELSVEEDML